MPERTYGEITGFPIGSTFNNRRELHEAGVHRPTQAGISGGKDGADSIVVSGGYEDDEDFGHVIIYTGQGGQDPDTREQIADQVLTHGNAGLARSSIEGHPVRVVRGAGGDAEHSPASGLRYDGLYRVADFWHATGRSGFRVWRFRLVADGETDPALDNDQSDGSDEPAARAQVTIQRIVRNTAVAQHVKELHRHACQICGIRIVTPAGPYAEAAHIRGLGKPHHGPDTRGNVLCLCPNHHVMFDTGAIYIESDWTVRDSLTNDVVGKLRRSPSHAIDVRQLDYHREHIAL
ncbi:HNH endonuclease [Actinoplanes bogorensis]|uniref:HNH endonuclease n=1 Tax=Paractinoplanes bogorensis TaxID=1610840 RepID=A0ABS5YIX2_9ACTN|nr:YDG/SRA domain-containing protein [Actinoplanes bogorensis]MBU2663385.1 HNH endonuclease [Actinoplanes bogorensis]